MKHCEMFFSGGVLVIFALLYGAVNPTSAMMAGEVIAGCMAVVYTVRLVMQKEMTVELKNKTVQAQMGIHSAQLGLLEVGETSNEEKA